MVETVRLSIGLDLTSSILSYYQVTVEMHPCQVEVAQAIASLG